MGGHPDRRLLFHRRHTQLQLNELYSTGDNMDLGNGFQRGDRFRLILAGVLPQPGFLLQVADLSHRVPVWVSNPYTMPGLSASSSGGIIYMLFNAEL